MGDHSSNCPFLLNQPSDFSQEHSKMLSHYCPRNCAGIDKKKCWNYFYSWINSKRTYDQEYYEQSLNFPNPYIDTAINKLQQMNDQGWYNESRGLISTIYENRNPNSELLTQLYNTKAQIHIITIGSTPGYEIMEIVDKVKKSLLIDERENKMIPPFTMRAFGFLEQDPEIHSCLIPHKLVITDSFDIYIEINFPVRRYNTGSVIAFHNYPKELNSLFNLFKPETGLAILLTHNHETELEACLDAFRTLHEGDTVEFPGYTDVVTLYTYLSSYCVNYNLNYMYRLIIGGTILDDQEVYQPQHWNVEFSRLEEWAKIYILATSRAITILYYGFFILNIDRMLPDKEFLLKTVDFKGPGYIIARLQAIIGECLAYIQFDNVEYYNTPPEVRYRCVQPFYPKNPTIISAAWREYCVNHQSPIFDQIEQFWPWNKPLIVNPSWVAYQLMDTRLIKLLVSSNTWYSKNTPKLRNVHEIPKEGNESSIGELVNNSNNLREILKALSPDKSKAWIVLEEYLLQHPKLLLGWFKRMKGLNKKSRPSEFIVGNRSNLRALYRIKDKIAII